jgi:hypothetical protein
MPFTARAALIVLVTTCATDARASEAALRLVEAPEAVTVRSHCSGCHSLDYIQMNSRFMKRAGWESEVRKMVRVMGAPVPEDEVAKIVEYLTTYYGVN